MVNYSKIIEPPRVMTYNTWIQYVYMELRKRQLERKYAKEIAEGNRKLNA